jgi:hypothetical protein
MTNHEYRNEIKEIAISIDDAELWNETTDRSERLHETIDGHKWIIYTRFHDDILLHTRSDNYGFDNGLIDTKISSIGESENLKAVIAFWAFYGDVESELS